MRTKNSRLLAEVHETAADMHRLGFIDKRKMREHDVLCLPTIPDYGGSRSESATRTTPAKSSRAGSGT